MSEWKVGDQGVLNHLPKSFYGKEIVIPFTVVELLPLTGRLRVVTENQTIVIKASFVSKS